MKNKGEIAAISISEKKSAPKKNVRRALLEKEHGIVGDAHSGSERQVSLLALESIEKIKEKGVNVKPGDFAENITTQGIDLSKLSPGMRLKIGSNSAALIRPSWSSAGIHPPAPMRRSTNF